MCVHRLIHRRTLFASVWISFVYFRCVSSHCMPSLTNYHPHTCTWASALSVNGRHNSSTAAEGVLHIDNHRISQGSSGGGSSVEDDCPAILAAITLACGVTEYNSGLISVSTANYALMVYKTVLVPALAQFDFSPKTVVHKFTWPIVFRVPTV